MEEEIEDREVCFIEEQEEEEVVGEPDEEELLVIRRTLNNQKNSEEQRENIFHNRCTIQGKVCSLIVDSKSCFKVASTILVEKLRLQTSIHPHPARFSS